MDANDKKFITEMTKKYKKLFKDARRKTMRGVTDPTTFSGLSVRLKANKTQGG